MEKAVVAGAWFRVSFAHSRDHDFQDVFVWTEKVFTNDFTDVFAHELKNIDILMQRKTLRFQAVAEHAHVGDKHIVGNAVEFQPFLVNSQNGVDFYKYLGCDIIQVDGFYPFFHNQVGCLFQFKNESSCLKTAFMVIAVHRGYSKGHMPFVIDVFPTLGFFFAQDDFFEH